MKAIKAALFRKLQVMKNQIHFKQEKVDIDWLLDICGSKEYVISLLSDYYLLEELNTIERRLRENENFTTN